MMDEDVQGQVVALRKFLRHDEPLVRMKAAHALGMIGLPGDPNSLPVLKKALEKETDPAAQGEMRGAIGRLEPKQK